MSSTNKILASLDEHITNYVNELAHLLRAEVTEELTHYSDQAILDVCLAIAKISQPSCIQLETEDPERCFRFQITSPRAASCLGGIIGNDTNADLHIGPSGTTQSNAIIGICTDAVMKALGGELLEVKPLNFRNPVPLGQSVIVQINLKRRSKLTLGTIEITRQDGETVMRLSDIKMSPA